jgi:hypothetical protein
MAQNVLEVLFGVGFGGGDALKRFPKILTIRSCSKGRKTSNLRREDFVEQLRL